MSNKKNVLLCVASGSEEIETLTVLDLLRRAGAAVTFASPNGGKVKMAHGLEVFSEAKIADLVEQDFDLVCLPGGLPGTYNLRDCEALSKILENQQAKGGLIAAICAAPAFILGAKGFLKGRHATCYPGCETGIEGVAWETEEAAVRDGQFITGRGPGAAYPFALSLVEALYGSPFRQQLANDTMYR